MNRHRKTDDTTAYPHDEERLSAYLDGELAPQEREMVRQHLAECPDCEWDLATLQQTVQWTRELPAVPMPCAFTIPVKVEPERAPRRSWTLLPVLQGAAALVALLLFVTVAGDFWINGFEFARAPMPQAVVQTIQVEVQATQVVEEATGATAELKAAAPEVVGAPEVTVTQGMAAAAEAAATAVPAPAEPQATATAAAAATMAPAGMGVGGEMGGPTAEAQADQTASAAAQPPSEMQPFVATEQAEATANVAAAASVAEAVTADSAAATPSAAEVAEPAAVAKEAPSAEGARVAPTDVAEAPAAPEVLGVQQERAGAAERYEPGLPWLRVVELGLAVALLLLMAATFLLVLQRRRAR